MEEKKIIKEYFSNLAKKSHKAVKKKYGHGFYAAIQRKRWEKYRQEKREKKEF